MGYFATPINFAALFFPSLVVSPQREKYDKLLYVPQSKGLLFYLGIKSTDSLVKLRMERSHFFCSGVVVNEWTRVAMWSGGSNF